MARIFKLGDYPSDFPAFTMMCTNKWLSYQLGQAESAGDLSLQAEIRGLHKLFRRCSSRRGIMVKKREFLDGMNELNEALFFQKLSEHEEKAEWRLEEPKEAQSICSSKEVL